MTLNVLKEFVHRFLTTDLVFLLPTLLYVTLFNDIMFQKVFLVDMFLSYMHFYLF